MTVVVGYLAGKSGTAPLHLAVGAARTLRTSLTVATIVPKPWTYAVTGPGRRRIRRVGRPTRRRLGQGGAALPRQSLSTALEVTYHSHAHRSVSGGLVEVVDELGADLLVLGSSANGQLGQVVVGSTADRLLHSSPVPVAIAPRGYRGARAGVLTRITCGYPGTPESVDVVRRIADLAERLEVPLRVITFAVRGRTMYPPEVGLHAEDSILAAWETRPARCWPSCAPTASSATTSRCRWSAATAGIRRSTPPSGRTARSWRWAPHRAATSPGCSSARAARRSCGTAPFRCWCCPASVSALPLVTEAVAVVLITRNFAR